MAFPHIELFRFFTDHELRGDTPEYRLALRDHIVALWVEYQLNRFEPVTVEAFDQFLQSRLDTYMTPQLRSQLLNSLRRNEIYIFIAPPEPEHRRRRRARGPRAPRG